MNPFNRDDHEPTDAEVEAIVAQAIAAEASVARREAAPPSSGVVWWRAQMRARQEAARAVERPLTIVHGVAIACGLGLLLTIAGIAAAAIKGSAGWVGSLYRSMATSADPLAAIDFTSRWITLPMTAMLISALVASIAAYLILSDE